MNPTLRIVIPAILVCGTIGLCIGQGWIPQHIGIGAAVVLAVATAVGVRRARRLPPAAAPQQETPMPASTSSPTEPAAASGGTRTTAGGTYGDFVPNVAPPGMRDPSRGHELERDAMPATADFSLSPRQPDPAAAPLPTGLPAVASREERVRAAAFENYRRRNGAPGDALTDWLQAEAEIAAEPQGDRHA